MENIAVEVAENKSMYINFNSYAELIELMDNEKKYPTVLIGKNVKDETTFIDIESDFIEVGPIRVTVGFAGMCIGVIWPSRNCTMVVGSKEAVL